MAQLPTNPADFSIATFLAWVRTKPADGGYVYCDASNCAVAQFGRETDRPYLIDVTNLKDTYPELWDVVNCPGGHTFGALATRLEALAPEPSIWISVDAYMSEQARVSA